MSGIAATAAGCALAWGGLIVPGLRPLYDYAWFVGFGVAAVVYVALTRAFARNLGAQGVRRG